MRSNTNDLFYIPQKKVPTLGKYLYRSSCFYRSDPGIFWQQFYLPLLWIRKYFCQIRILASVMDHGSGSGRPINYRSGWIWIVPGHFFGHWKKLVVKYRKYFITKYYKIFFKRNFFESLMNSRIGSRKSFNSLSTGSTTLLVLCAKIVERVSNVRFR